MLIQIKVDACIHQCPFYGNRGPGRRMYCDHPVMALRDTEERYIIDWRHDKESVPDKCPLKENHVMTHVRLNEEKYKCS